MPQKSEFTLISGDEAKVRKEMTDLVLKGWRPILMSASGSGTLIILAVILEHALGA
jgi:hypothetical protein